MFFKKQINMRSEIIIFAVLFLVVVIVIGKILKHFFVNKDQFLDHYLGNNKLIPWNYSEKEGQWVSPEKPFPLSRMNGNTYLGDDEIEINWENFNKKD